MKELFGSLFLLMAVITGTAALVLSVPVILALGLIVVVLFSVPTLFFFMTSSLMKN